MRWLPLLIVVALCSPVSAQDDEPVISSIPYNVTVEETITTTAIFDWWQIEAVEGDVMRLQMIGSDELAPQLAILSPERERVAVSPEGEVNGIVRLEYTVPADGLYTILATRVGETSGAYSLTLQQINPQSNTNDESVVYICNGDEMAVLASFQFVDDESTTGLYPLYVYGFDGLLPALRFQSSEQVIDVCHRDAQDQAGDVLMLPETEPFTLAVDQLDTASQLTVNTNNLNMGTTTVTFVASSDTSGRYMGIIGGFTISPNDDTDSIRIRVGGLASRDTSLQIYMVGVGANSRLDPFMRFVGDEAGCDDAGRRGCDGLPSFNGSGVIFNTGARLIGDRFDAGLSLPVDSTGWHEIELGSFSGNTGGDYVLFVVGELPPRTISPAPAAP